MLGAALSPQRSHLSLHLLSSLPPGLMLASPAPLLLEPRHSRASRRERREHHCPRFCSSLPMPAALGTQGGPPHPLLCSVLSPGTSALFNWYPAPPDRLHRGSLQELQPERTGRWSGEDALGEPSGMNSFRCLFFLTGAVKGLSSRAFLSQNQYPP